MTSFDQRNQQVGTQYNADHISIYPHATPHLSADAERRRDRNRMLKRVQSRIESVLGKPLVGTLYLTLNLQEQPNAIARSPKPLQRLNQSIAISNDHILQIYEEAAGELLILGESGSGKTTLLQKLAQELIEFALQDDTLPIPVIFNLSSWAIKRQPLTDWLVEELHDIYGIQPQLSQLWVNNNQVLPLLDGLDKVPQKYLATCIEAINTYRKGHGLLPTVVCSQTSAYLSQKRLLLLHKAVTIQPLTDQQIDEYLARHIERRLSDGDQVPKNLYAAIQQDRKLRELASTPLMLNFLLQTYQGESFNGATQVLESFIRQMLDDPDATAPFRPHLTIHWLTWLAWQMTQHSLTEFYIERIQPEWLPPGFLTRFFKKLNIKIIPAEVVVWSWRNMRRGFVKAFRKELIPWLIFGQIVSNFGLLAIGHPGGMLGLLPYNLPKWVQGVFIALVGGISLGLFRGILSGVSKGLSGKMLDERTYAIPNQGIWRSARNSARIGILLWVSSGLLFAAFFVISGGFFLLNVVAGVILGLVVGLVTWLLVGGAACIEHMILRLLLWRTKYAPLNYPRFLRYVAECNLIYNVGGGYIFFHSQLQDYFTSRLKDEFPTLNPTPTLNVSEKQVQATRTSSPVSKMRRKRVHHKRLPRTTV